VGSDAGKLERHPSLDERFDPAILVVEYDPAWADQAQEELNRLADGLGSGAVRLEHVGSTAVPGLAAKPILDLQLSVVVIEPRERYVSRLGPLGYLFVPDPESSDFHFFAKPAERPRSHHLHVCEVDSEHEFRHLALRNYLRSHADEAVKYAAPKREVAKRSRRDRFAYIDGKEQYVRDLEGRAVQWAHTEPTGRALA
jgi:GrpB-like predicted nucleotidyltransferase (UPF0157 family)